MAIITTILNKKFYKRTGITIIILCRIKNNNNNKNISNKKDHQKYFYTLYKKKKKNFKKDKELFLFVYKVGHHTKTPTSPQKKYQIFISQNSA